MPEVTFLFKSIGVLHTPYKTIENMPIQPGGAQGLAGTLIIDSKYIEGLRDLEGFSHIFLIYCFHKVSGPQLTVTPFLDSKPHGVFATRAPKRPNPIGLSVVRLVSIKENVLSLENVDMLDGTPVLDIKPYVPAFDEQDGVRVGWLASSNAAVKTKRSDTRFS